ncbi:ABC transporter substrate-binding protein [Fluviicola taffensis]|uniref:ABC transporter substrate-binding protein n=1 Tax=Fluviicola taffensis TaxID=191579 RepID=UPI0031380982
MNISLLIPRSVLYPSMGFDIVDGIKESLKKAGVNDPRFDINNIGVAARDQDIFASCEKVLMNGADIVVAYINPSTAEYVHGLFEANNKILLVLDSGMHFLPQNKLSNAFFISLDGMLCCRATTNLAVNAGYLQNIFTCSFYDAGYRGPLSFSNALEKSGGHVSFNHVTALKRSEFTLEPIKEHLAQNTEQGILAAFCGDMALDFYKSLSETASIKDTAVFGSPFMIEEVWLDKIPYSGQKITAVSSWARALDNPENITFKEVLNKPGKANVFSVIAWEAGILLSMVLEAPVESVINIWSTCEFNSPRGSVRMNPDSNYLESPIYQCEVIEGENGFCALNIVNEIASANDEREQLISEMKAYGDQTSNSWHNAYPCLES